MEKKRSLACKGKLRQGGWGGTGDLPPTPSSLAYNVSCILHAYGPLWDTGGKGEDVVET